MKHTVRTLALAALLAAASLAQANTWYQPNEAGGRIILTDRACPVANSHPLREAYAYSRSGTRQAACWTIFDGLVQISWQGGERSTHPLESFTASPDNTPAQPARATPSKKSLDL